MLAGCWVNALEYNRLKGWVGRLCKWVLTRGVCVLHGRGVCDVCPDMRGRMGGVFC